MGVLVLSNSGPHSHSGAQVSGGSAVFSSSTTAVMIPGHRKRKWPGGVHEGDFKGLDRSSKYLLSPALYCR